jgi:hypothetical protein
VKGELDYALSQLVEEIERLEATRRKFGAVLEQLKDTIDLGKFPAVAINAVENKLVSKIKPTKLSGLRIAGIDGGLIRKRFRTMDLLLTRGLAVIFQFGPKEGPSVEFYPDPFPEPNIKPVMLTMSGPELDQIASLERLATELRVTLSVLDEFHTDLILVDGSLFYHPRDRPSKGSVVDAKFQEIAALYKQLYNKAKKKRTILVGVIKDSRSTRIVNILGEILPHIIREPRVFELMQGIDYRWLLKVSRDCDLLDTFLKEGERTFAFKYSAELTTNTNPLADSLLSWSSDIWVTYLKTASNDLPIRLEILTKKDSNIKQLNKALSSILPLSWQHPEYGLPTPIVEADARARITTNESRLVIARLMAMSGLTYTTLEKRRSRNPFSGG